MPISSTILLWSTNISFPHYSSPWNGGICSICYEVQSQKCRDWSDNFWQMNQYPWPNLRIYIAGFCKLYKWIYPLLYPIINNCTRWQALPMDCIGLGDKNHYEKYYGFIAIVILETTLHAIFNDVLAFQHLGCLLINTAGGLKLTIYIHRFISYPGR